MHLRRPFRAFVALTALVLLIPAGCAKKEDAVTTPGTGPTADFTATPRSGDRPLDVDFSDLSAPGTSPITSVLWDFGDGSAPSAIGFHSYGAAGTYTVSLTVTTAEGSDTETKANFIVVASGPGPTAGFTANRTGGPAPLQVQFTDQSSTGGSGILARSWTFGDGGTSTQQNPAHTYVANGSYTVSLSVTTAVSSNTETKPNYIVVGASPVPPTAQFTGTPRDGPVPLTVDFTDHSSPGSASITTWAWTFGDGGTSAAPNPSHTYAAAGSYTVSLTVTTSAGSDVETQPSYITVHAAPVAPTAQFSGTPTSGSAPLSVQFTDQSVPGTSPITSRSWNFGDGTAPSGAANPSHVYGAAGNYTVTLTVTTDDGQDSETKTEFIKVCGAPAADFAGLPTTGPSPLIVQFSDLSTPAATSWSWNFGDGTAAGTVKDPSHTYLAPGAYNVSLRVQNACGTDSVTKAGYIIATDACPNPVYSIADARWDTITDADMDGYRTRARFVWNADVSDVCPKSVFARVSYRAPGETAWTLAGQSACYTITGSSTTDNRTMFVSGLPAACYEFQIELFECSGTTAKATRGPADDTDLTNQCFEP